MQVSLIVRGSRNRGLKGGAWLKISKREEVLVVGVVSLCWGFDWEGGACFNEET